MRNLANLSGYKLLLEKHNNPVKKTNFV